MIKAVSEAGGFTAAPRGEAIIKAMITLADALGFQVVAEGVETVEQRDFLTGSGVVIG